MLHLAQAESPEAIAAVGKLLREYQVLLGVDLCFQGFDAELQGLPGAYAAPSGRLLLATRDGAAVGCVALRDLGAGRCEMKRLFVRPSARGIGVGAALVAAVVEAAHATGYQEMVLDTLPSMTEARRMYDRLGFREIPAYCENPIAGTRYLALDLAGT